MARVIKKSCGKDVFELVKWQEFVVIFCHSVILNFFIVLKNILLSLKRHFDSQIGPTRQNIVNKFPALSLIGGSKVKCSEQLYQSIACPRQLMDLQLGNHKYIKLKVREYKLGQKIRLQCTLNVGFLMEKLDEKFHEISPSEEFKSVKVNTNGFFLLILLVCRNTFYGF